MPATPANPSSTPASPSAPTPSALQHAALTTQASPPDLPFADLPFAALSPQETPSPQDSPSDLPFADLPFAISPPEAALLESLTSPTADLPAIAAAHALSLTQLALWLRRPHIAEALDALHELHALSRRAWRDDLTREAVETLRDTMKAADDPVERRRSASAILRALRTPTTNGARSASEGHGAGRASDGPEPHEDDLDDEPLTWHEEQEARLAALREDPLHPSVLRAVDVDQPAPFPHDIRPDPEAFTDLIADRCAALPDPSPRRLWRAISEGLHTSLLDEAARRPFLHALAASPFALCREGWTRTAHPLERNGAAAIRKYTWTHADGRKAVAALKLLDNGCKRAFNDHWWITAVESRGDTPTPDTS